MVHCYSVSQAQLAECTFSRMRVIGACLYTRIHKHLYLIITPLLVQDSTLWRCSNLNALASL